MVPAPEPTTANAVTAAMCARFKSTMLMSIREKGPGIEYRFGPTDHEGVKDFSVAAQQVLSCLGHVALPMEGIEPLEPGQHLIEG